MRPEPGEPSGDFRRVLRAARAGDESAWKDLYSWLAPQVLGFLRASRVGDPEDVLGDVFLEVARRLGGFHGDARGFRAWVFTIARARRVDGIRREVRRIEVPADLTAHEAIASGVDVEGDALAQVGLDELLTFLDRLTDEQSEVLVLRAIGGWTAREVGEITGRSTGSVEQLQHRAARALREFLDDA
jgi:RNA polymerase sigma-70 factor (ECF subfamily)